MWASGDFSKAQSFGSWLSLQGCSESAYRQVPRLGLKDSRGPLKECLEVLTFGGACLRCFCLVKLRGEPKPRLATVEKARRAMSYSSLLQSMTQNSLNMHQNSYSRPQDVVGSMVQVELLNLNPPKPTQVVLCTFLYGFSLGPLFPGALLVAEESDRCRVEVGK